MKKYARCYSCYAYESQESPGMPCLAGEKQAFVKSKYGKIAFATKHYCKIKNIKDLIKRQELLLRRD